MFPAMYVDPRVVAVQQMHLQHQHIMYLAAQREMLFRQQQLQAQCQMEYARQVAAAECEVRRAAAAQERGLLRKMKASQTSSRSGASSDEESGVSDNCDAQEDHQTLVHQAQKTYLHTLRRQVQHVGGRTLTVDDIRALPASARVRVYSHDKSGTGVNSSTGVARVGRLSLGSGGSFRIAFPAHIDCDLIGPCVVENGWVVKAFRRPTSPADVFLNNKTSIIGQQFAKRFNEEIGSHLVSFVPVFVIQFIDLPGCPVASLEARLFGDYVKWNNNADYVRSVDHSDAEGKRRCQIAQAFSHFTLKKSRREVLMVDIQGCGGGRHSFYTDPAIHSKAAGQFGGTDFGVEGQAKFLRGHKCNKFCKALEL